MGVNESRCGGWKLTENTALIADHDPAVLPVSAGHQFGYPAPVGRNTFGVTIDRKPAAMRGENQPDNPAMSHQNLTKSATPISKTTSPMPRAYARPPTGRRGSQVAVSSPMLATLLTRLPA